MDARPAALVAGRAVTWGDLRPALNEIGGATALRDYILDRQLEAEIQRTGVIVTEADAAAEQRLLLDTLDVDPDRALRLLDQLRTRQGLGPQRYALLLRRNAMLRALVRDQVTVSSASIDRMYEILHGARRQARLILVPSLSDARAVIDRLDAGEPFAEIAVETSTDASAPRGGLLAPIARDDPTYPNAIRRTLWTLEPGAVSSPILVDGGYAVIQLAREVPWDGTEKQVVRPQLERAVRQSQERLLMDELARRLLRDVSVTIFDDALQESWTRAQTPAAP
ncbi:MAG: peptidylprolyl isomerase [Planctomycetota bacterium]